MKQQIISAINQAVISFTFGGDTFNIDCHLEGIKPNTHLFNALDAQQFTPLFDEQADAYVFVPVELWMRDLPMFLTTQAH